MVVLQISDTCWHSSKSSKLACTIFDVFSTQVFWCRFVLKSFLHDLIYIENNNFFSSIQFFHNHFAWLKAFYLFSYSVSIEIENLKRCGIMLETMSIVNPGIWKQIDVSRTSYVMLKQFLFLISFTTFILGGIFWWTDWIIKINLKLYNATNFEP